MAQLFEFLLNHWILSSAFSATLVLLMAHEAKSRILGINEVQPGDLTRMINHDNAAVLDVRDGDQFRTGHIIHAMHTPFALLEEQLDQYSEYKDSPLIVYCSNGQQSARACALFNKAGFNQLHKLAGGIATWKNAGLPLSKD